MATPKSVLTEAEINVLKLLAAFILAGGTAEPAGEAPKPPEPNEPEDDLVDLDRKALKKIITDEELEVTFNIKTSDDELRGLIREARGAGAGAGEPEPPEPAEPEVELKKGQIVKFKVKGKTHSGKVKDIDYEAGKVKVTSDTDKKLYELAPDELFT
jgi:hypothetical protein